MRPTIPILPLECAHAWVAAVAGRGDTVIDATAGNGHDSLFLAELVGVEGVLHVFDVQQEALERTAERLGSHGCLDGRVVLHHRSHADMGRIGCAAPRAVMFNLGYLPGGDKAVITQAQETLRAVGAALSILAPGGIVTVMCYPGHEGGGSEAEAVRDLLSSLDSREWRVAQTTVVNRSGSAPFLLAAMRTG